MCELKLNAQLFQSHKELMIVGRIPPEGGCSVLELDGGSSLKQQNELVGQPGTMCGGGEAGKF